MTAGTICFGLLGLIMYCSADAPTVTREFCQVAKIINPARADTALTKRQILAHNAKHRRLCSDKRGFGR
jgi:hypothetical protein